MILLITLGWAWFAVVTVIFGGRRLVLGAPTRALASELAEGDTGEEYKSLVATTTGDDRSGS